MNEENVYRYEYMIDNVILLLKGTLNGRDVNELIEKVSCWNSEDKIHF